MTSIATHNIQRGAACFAYGLVSTSITLFNKAVFAKFQFNYPNLVTSMQLAISILYMLAIRGFGLANIDQLPSQKLHKVRRKYSAPDCLQICTVSGQIHKDTRLQVVPMTFFWWLYVVSGITALRYMSVPMFR